MTARYTAIQLKGGLRLDAGPFFAPPGSAFEAVNYECDPAGGYRRSAGYERFDGRPAPSEGTSTADSAARRNAIQVVPGEGPVLGVAIFGGVAYAVRNVVGGASSTLWASSAGGWVSKKTGLPANGRWRFIVANFGGASGTRKLYGVSGKGKAFQYDGTTWTDITTGMATDTPTHIAYHQNHLFLAFPGGSVQFSPIGNPTGSWTPVLGAGEIGVGDDVTNLRGLRDQLVISTANSLHVLRGTSAASFTLAPYSRSIGALPDTMVEVLGDLLFASGDAILSLAAVQQYGDFGVAVMSAAVAPILRDIKPLFCAVIPSRSQLRAFLPNKLTLLETGRVGWTMHRDNVGFTCAAQGRDANGREWLLAGAGDGFVYTLDRGPSADDDPLLSTLRLSWLQLGSPHIKKRFVRAVLDFASDVPASLRFLAEYDFGETADLTNQSVSSSAGTGYWDVAQWDQFRWDSGYAVPRLTGYLSGVGRSVTLTIAHQSMTDAPFVITAMEINYVPRGQER